MTEPEAEHSERLRRALHAAADGVVPSRDGLERIRHRIAHERSRDSLALLLGWLKSLVMDFRFLIADLRSAAPPVRPIAHALKVRAVLVLAPIAAAVSSAVTALGPAARSAVTAVMPAARSAAASVQRTAVPALRITARTVRSAGSATRTAVAAVKSIVPERLRASDWLRPVLATAAAVIVAIVMLLAIPGVRHNIMPSSNDTSPKPGQSQPTAPGTAGQSPSTGGSAPQGTSKSASPSTSSSATPSGSPSPCPSPSAASTSTCVPPPPVNLTASPTPSPSASPSPTLTSPSPSPSDTTSPDTPVGGESSTSSEG